MANRLQCKYAMPNTSAAWQGCVPQYPALEAQWYEPTATHPGPVSYRIKVWARLLPEKEYTSAGQATP